MQEVDIEESGYRVLPNFVSHDDPQIIGAVNGWNNLLESWLIEVQRDCNTNYLMLVETATALVFVKWVLIAVNVLLALSGLIATAIAVPLSSTTNIVQNSTVVCQSNDLGIWLPIYTAAVAAVGAAMFSIYESLDINSWNKDCRDVAGEFIILGKSIESQKRVPRLERTYHFGVPSVLSGVKRECLIFPLGAGTTTGLDFTNDISTQFEHLRATMPSVLSLIRKRHAMPPAKKISNNHLNVPIKLMDIHASVLQENNMVVEDAKVAQEKDDDYKLAPTDLAKLKDSQIGKGGGQTLQDLFQARLELVRSQKRDQDELVEYENYVRSGYSALASERVPRAIVNKE